ncbi:MAG: DsbA family protein [Bacteroidia bacterium]
MSNIKLLYFTDPMCSTCYGFVNELNLVLANLAKNIDFEIVVGGLRPHGSETIKEMKSFLSTQWQQVEERSGAIFNYNILDLCNLKYDTEPACRAIVTMKSLNPDSVFEYLKTIQKGFYYHNYSPNEPSTFALQAKDFGVDLHNFLEAFNSNEIKERTLNEFNKTKSFGVSNYPTLAIYKLDKLNIVAQGFGNHKVILNRIESLV